jgi:pyroglutamyl-peptidase
VAPVSPAQCQKPVAGQPLGAHAGPGLSGSAAPGILITGFDAFGEHRDQGDNPSARAAWALRGQSLDEHPIEAVCLPTQFAAARRHLLELLERPWAMVLCVGQAGGRAAIGLERVAININDARIPDNVGQQPVDEPVVAGGPPAYFSTLPLKACVQALNAAGLPAEVSNTAGTFVCNHVFYSLMHALADRPGGPRVPAGFVHLPWLPEQGTPSLPLAAMTQALRLIAHTTLLTPTDLRLPGGKIS